MVCKVSCFQRTRVIVIFIDHQLNSIRGCFHKLTCNKLILFLQVKKLVTCHWLKIIRKIHSLQNVFKNYFLVNMSLSRINADKGTQKN